MPIQRRGKRAIDSLASKGRGPIMPIFLPRDDTFATLSAMITPAIFVTADATLIIDFQSGVAGRGPDPSA